ncbi:MAG TPA: acetate--CoA ligase [Nitrosopumilaceae archaeon]|nr:acetate--CoA ligase [Nitrosopumilaceae archaeon]
MPDFVFTPTEQQIQYSNIHAFMKKHDIKTLEDLSNRAKKDLDWFWSKVDEDIGIVWHKKYHSVHDFSAGYAWSKWFVGGKTNIIISSVEKFSKKSPEKIAYYFISEDCTKTQITYKELEDDINKLANGLKALGMTKGDVVAIYMPMIKEAIIAILACAKIGAVQTVIFSGYSSESLKIRLQDCNAKVLFVTDGFERKGKKILQKKIVDVAIQGTSIKKIIVTKYKGDDDFGRNDLVTYYDELVSNQPSTCNTEVMNSEDPLFILYTSGTTGKPKGVIHSHGGFSVFAGHQASYLIDTHPDDVLLWPADIGWITGLVWNVYGLLEIGATAVIYDGAIDWPNYDRLWQIIEEYKVTIFGVSPTAVRMFKKNNVVLQKFDLKSIRIMPTTGEPIDEESWMWLFEKVGNKKVPIMNLAGGTEIGGAMLSVFPGMKLKPTTVGVPCPGMTLDVFDDNGKSIQNKKGYLVVKAPWPAMTKGLLNDNERYLQTYWSRFENVWFHGDYVLVDNDGLWYMHGRVDDVINVAGHRLSTAEIEQTAISNNNIAEAASISIPDEITGESIVLFIVLENKLQNQNIENEISEYIVEKIGKLAKPKRVFTISDLPKTRTGKIMRRLLKAKLLGESLGDLSSLENPYVLDEVSKIK